MTELDSAQQYEVEEFRYAAQNYVEAVDSGDAGAISATVYALEMAAAACQLRGLDPDKITPTGYDEDHE